MSNPIAQAYIDRTIESKENAKITNKLIRNEDMSKIEALQAKKQLKNHFLPPAVLHYQLESNDRVLRSNK